MQSLQCATNLKIGLGWGKGSKSHGNVRQLLKAKLYPSGQMRGRMGIESKKGTINKGGRFASTTIASIYAIKRCSMLEIFPYHLKGITKNVS
jgi:hypothetical protein